MGREVLWRVARNGSRPITAHLIAFHDAVDLHLDVENLRGRRLRFLRDTSARVYARRLRHHLEQRGYRDRRAPERTTWPEDVR